MEAPKHKKYFSLMSQIYIDNKSYVASISVHFGTGCRGGKGGRRITSFTARCGCFVLLKHLNDVFRYVTTLKKREMKRKIF